jgi:hypothetical protein
MADGIAPSIERGRLAELRSSAKGWHGIQLAALGFVGLCGVLQRGDPSTPQNLQVLSRILVLVALALACAGIVLVGRAAWPLYSGAAEPADAEERVLARTSRELTTGLVMTFASVAVLSLATAASWWPTDEQAAGAVEVRASDGRSWCGQLAEAPQEGALRVVGGSQDVVVAIGELAGLRSTDDCQR